jgi:hypothetical protein
LITVPQIIPIERLRIFSFNGVEIEDKDELSMIENNSYLFVTLGKTLILNYCANKGESYDGRACLGAFHKIRVLGEVINIFKKVNLGRIRKSISGIQQDD